MNWMNIDTDKNLSMPLFGKEWTSSSWRTAMALSLLLHLTVVCLMTVLIKRPEGGRDIEYIAVDLILPSGEESRAAGQSKLRADVSPRQEPAPQPFVEQGPPVQNIAGLVQKVPESSPDAHPPLQSSPQPYGDMSGSSPEGTRYQPVHAVSRVPSFKVQKKPLYPSSERAAGVTARVVVEVYISDAGAVDKVEVIKSGGPRFDEAVIEAVKGSSFEPGYRDGKPVRVRVQVPYVFKLK